MGIDARAAWALRDALSGGKKAAEGRTDTAEVTRIDEAGTPWVHIAGGVEETPVNGTVAASVNVGDVVTVSIENGRMSVVGNSSAPSVGQEFVEQTLMPAMTAAFEAQSAAVTAKSAATTAEASAIAAKDSAETAETKAGQAIQDAATAYGAAQDAQTAAGEAKDAADAAGAAAGSAQSSADAAAAAAATANDNATTALRNASAASSAAQQAQTSATAAGNYAATALAGLGTVQSVGETLAWVAQHGQMVSTTDTSIDPTKVYFVQDPNGEYTVGGVRYSIVKAPKASGLGTYYELKMLDSVQNYLTTHLAVTEDGLHVFGESGRVIVGENAGFHVTINPEKLAFCQGQRSDGHGGFEDNEIAWITNNELHVPKAVITEGLQVGHWRWTELSNGNFALKYIA